MSLGIIKKNLGSPFHLQRSIVNQGGEGGAYESGGYNPDSFYDNSPANALVESFGKVVGAALSARAKNNVIKKSKKTLKVTEKFE